MDEALSILLRSVHILSVVMLLGRVLHVRFVAPASPRPPAWYVVTPIVLLIATGLWQFTQALAGGVDKYWHMVFGAKMLLALHIVTIALLSLRPNIDDAKRKRWTNGVMFSGIAVIILSATLRWLRGIT